MRFAAFRAAVFAYHGPTNRPWNIDSTDIIDNDIQKSNYSTCSVLLTLSLLVANLVNMK